MRYVLVKNGNQVHQYPYSFMDLRRDNPMVSFPSVVDDELLAEWNVHKVSPTERPDSTTQIVEEIEPIFENGEWIQRWSVSDLPDPTEQQLIDYAKDKRWQYEVAGVDVGGIHVSTDRESQVKIVGARVAADSNPAWSTIWDAADGNTYPIDASTMILVSDAVEAYVNNCFVTYAAIKGDIDNGLITSFLEIDQAFDSAIT